MIDKKDLFIRIIDPAPDIKYRVEHTNDGEMIVHEKPENEWKDHSVMQGGITINGHLSTFYMSLEVWSAADYVQQWDEGMQQLEKHGKTCLVANVVDDRLSAVKWWTLYRVNGEIRMQHHVLCESPYAEAIQSRSFTPETCYDFIPFRKTHEDDGEEISEWTVDGDYEPEVLPVVKGIQIKIIDSNYRDDSVLCRIFIGNDFYETFELTVDCCWSIDEYVRQWKKGLERLRTHDTSCLVMSASNPGCGHFINWWLLYKKNGIVYARNQIVLEHIYEEIIGTKSFTVENCYDFIPTLDPSEDQSKNISELYVNYSDIDL